MVLENYPENANIITAIYWATTTITTVGFGDVVFTSQGGRLFSIIIQIVGVIRNFEFSYHLCNNSLDGQYYQV